MPLRWATNENHSHRNPQSISRFPAFVHCSNAAVAGASVTLIGQKLRALRTADLRMTGGRHTAAGRQWHGDCYAHSVLPEHCDAAAAD